MLRRLALLFLLVPVLEFLLLLRMGEWIGGWPTLALVLATGFVGVLLVRGEGVRRLRRLRGDLSSGRAPAGAMGGISLVAGGLLLMFPGLVTDVLGLVLLFPPTRALLVGWLGGRMAAALSSGGVRVVHWQGGFGGVGGSPTAPTSRTPRPGEIIQD